MKLMNKKGLKMVVKPENPRKWKKDNDEKMLADSMKKYGDLSGSFMGFVDCDCKFDEGLPLKEDLDISLQVMNKYRKLLRINFVHLVKKDNRNLGGCADYRTIEREKEQFELLLKKWGSKIVRRDDGVKKGGREKMYDINPIINVPIKGI